MLLRVVWARFHVLLLCDSCAAVMVVVVCVFVAEWLPLVDGGYRCPGFNVWLWFVGGWLPKCRHSFPPNFLCLFLVVQVRFPSQLVSFASMLLVSFVSMLLVSFASKFLGAHAFPESNKNLCCPTLCVEHSQRTFEKHR